MRCLGIANDWAVAGAARGVGHISLAFDFDNPRGIGKTSPACGCFVLLWVGRIDLFDVQVLHVWRCVGKTPSQLGSAAQNYRRHARQGRPDDVRFRGCCALPFNLNARKIPNSRGA